MNLLENRTRQRLAHGSIVCLALLAVCGCRATLLNNAGTTDKRVAAPKPRIAWKISISGLPSGSHNNMALGDHAVYVGGDALRAFTLDGKLAWSYGTGGYRVGSPSVGQDGTIYFISKNTLYACDQKGTKKFQVPAAGNVEYSPAVAEDGTIYVAECRERDKIAADEDYQTGDPALSEADRTTSLLAFNPDGRQKWSHEVPGILSNPPVVGKDGTVYVTFGSDGEFEMKDNKLRAVSVSGVTRWQVECGGVPRAPVIGKDGSIYISAGMQPLSAFSSDGSKKWERKGYVSPAVAKDGTVYAIGNGLKDGISALRPDTFKEKWNLVPDEPGADTLVVGSDGTTYFSTDDCGELDPVYRGEHFFLFAVSSGGKEKWRLKLDEFGSGFSVGNDGSVYFFGAFKNLIAVRDH